MTDRVLHYIHDPLCGWCYGAAPLVAAAREVLPVHAHGGGMMAGRNRRQVTPELRAYVMPHDHRIAQMSGQVFGEDYFNGLLTDSGAVFDSGPPIAAILGMQELLGNDAGLDLLAAIQQAHYQQGRRIAETATLLALAVQLGADEAHFSRALEQAQQRTLGAHIDASLQLLDQVGARGFPTFVLQRGNTLEMLDAGIWLGRPEPWKQFLQSK